MGRAPSACRSFKTVDLKVRPIHRHRPEGVRARVLLCMPACPVEWPMRHQLAPRLLDHHDSQAPRAGRAAVVAPATPSPAAPRKAATRRSPDGEPLPGFRTLLDDLATIARNRVQPLPGQANPFDIIPRPTPQQPQALELPGLTLKRSRYPISDNPPWFK